jgi:hypothetical protein
MTQGTLSLSVWFTTIYKLTQIPPLNQTKSPKYGAFKGFYQGLVVYIVVQGYGQVKNLPSLEKGDCISVKGRLIQHTSNQRRRIPAITWIIIRTRRLGYVL